MTFSSFVVYKILLSGIILFLFFRLLKFILPALIKNSTTQKQIQKYIPFIEFFLWILFLVWTSKLLVSQNHYFALILLGVMFSVAVWGAWFLFRDYIAGLIIKSQTDINIDEHISLQNNNGRIKAFNYRNLQLETDKGEIIQIPYSSILKENITKSDSAKTVSGHTFEIKVEKKDSLKNTEANIKETILCLPWASLKKNPIVKPVKEEEKYYILEVTVYSLKKHFFYNIENYIKKMYE